MYVILLISLNNLDFLSLNTFITTVHGASQSYAK